MSLLFSLLLCFAIIVHSERCGYDWTDANNNCRTACTNDGPCVGNGQRCFASLKACSSPAAKLGEWAFCSTNSECANNCCSRAYSNDQRYKCTPGTSECGGSGTGPTPSPPSGGGGGSVGALIDGNRFRNALSACGISVDIYPSLTRGFTAPLRDLKELALLVGHIAHESGAFIYTEEIACKGVRHVTSACPYGLYHGRGYIQLSWDYNYRAAANALGNQAIFNNPDIVMNDQTVNWQTVQWFWTTSVQPRLRRSGYTLAASTQAINGGLECGGRPISPQRIRYVQCVQRQFGVEVDQNTWCASVNSAQSASGAVDTDDANTAAGSTPNADATADATATTTPTDASGSAGVPGYGIGLLVIGAFLLVSLTIVLVLVLTQKSEVEHF